MRMFKKLLSFSIVSIVSMSIIGCNNSTKTTDFDEKTLTEKSVKYSEQMATGDFESVTKDFSKKIKKQLNSEKLKNSWNEVTKDIGNFESVNDASFSVKNSTAKVDIILKYELNGLKISFSFDSHNEISGLWLNYSPIKENLASNNVFDEKEIFIGDGENKLNGILTLPKNTTKSPIVIMVQGSGQSDMDETIGKVANKPFKDIAQGLAKNGIASIRYNKRYFQYPDLAPKNITIQDEVLNDVSSAINFASNNEKVNNEQIYVLGHSLGGMLLPEIAKEHSNISGIISLAGSPRKLEDIILDQNKFALDTMSDKTAEEKSSILQQIENEINKIKDLTPNDKPTSILGINSEYWISLNNINTTKFIKELNIPILILQGEADFQVYSDIDYKEWKKILSGNNNATFKLYPNLNHLFMKTNGKSDLSEYDIKGSVDNEVISDISNWINK